MSTDNKDCYIPENLPDELFDMMLTAKQQVVYHKMKEHNERKKNKNLKRDTLILCKESRKTLSEWYEIWRNELLADMIMDEVFTEEEYEKFYEYIIRR